MKSVRYYNNKINAIMLFPSYAKYYIETSLRISSTPRYIELKKKELLEWGLQMSRFLPN